MEPVPKGRPRTSFKNGKAQTYTPKDTVNAENQIRSEVATLLAELGRSDVIFEDEDYVRMNATFYMTRPKSAKKRKLPNIKPDWDNMGKLLTDAINGFLYKDDKIITTALIKKRYGFPPRIEFELYPDPDGEDF